MVHLRYIQFIIGNKCKGVFDTVIDEEIAKLV